MANIKFSQFTVGNTESDIDFVVGYKGANNIQISPANLLSATLAGYLPLTGGTMSGNIVFTDNVQAQFGTGNDLRLVHNGSDSYIQQTGVGDLIVQQTVADADISFQADNGSGGVAEYFRLDGSAAITVVSKEFRFGDNVPIKLGTGPDFQILHNGTTTSFENSTGNLLITNFADNSDIIFKSDDGSGGVTEYFKLQGVNERLVVAAPNGMKFNDNIQAKFGNGSDLEIYHDSINSYLKQVGTGDLIIRQSANNSDIVFESDNGSGGVATYFSIDGGAQLNRFAKNAMWNDNVSAYFGGGFDLKIIHNGTFSSIQNNTGDFKIINYADDTDIIFENDNGSGGTTEYFKLDGSRATGDYTYTTRPDGGVITFGDSLDLRLWHDPYNLHSYIRNYTNDLYIENTANGRDIVFGSDDGSAGVAEYFRLDGSGVLTFFSKPIQIADSQQIFIGDSGDLKIYHDGSDSYIDNITNHLVIQNQSANKDIIFKSDDGSGGVTTYFQLDGSQEVNVFSKNIKLEDNVKGLFGGGNDLQIFHNSTDSFIENQTGQLNIVNYANDKDIRFWSDDGSGGITTYFQLDGSIARTLFSRNTQHVDNSKAIFGSGDDLQIYHNGSNSFISDTGVGLLVLSTNHLQVYNSSITEVMITAVENGAVNLYYDNVKKLETTTTGIKITGVSEYADNTAAIAGGLTTGDVYRTGDLLKIVH